MRISIFNQNSEVVSTSIFKAMFVLLYLSKLTNLSKVSIFFLYRSTANNNNFLMTDIFVCYSIRLCNLVLIGTMISSIN